MSGEPFTAVSSALIDGPTAYATPAQLAGALGWPLDATRAALVALIDAGLLDAWPDCPGGFAVTLSVAAVAHLGVHLVETRDLEIFRWSRDAQTVRTRRGCTPRQLAAIDAHDRTLAAIADRPADDPGDALDAQERFQARYRRKTRALPALHRDDLPRPTILLTGQPTPWAEPPRTAKHRTDCADCTPTGQKRRKTVPIRCRCGRPGAEAAPGACPTCRGADLSRSTYCLRCGRWGWDDVLYAQARSRKRNAAAKAAERVG